MAKLNKEKIALNLLTYPTLKETAEKSGISEATLYRLRKDAGFQAILKSVKNEIFNDAMQKAQGYTLEALEVLRNVMKDEDATDSSRVSAARSILDIGITLFEDENIIQRLLELEGRLLNA